MSETSATSYQCPGEPYQISRAVHLGRLASFYDRCRVCPHRDDTGALAKSQVARLAAAHRRPLEPELFTDEGFAGVYLNEFEPARVERLAAALGVWLERCAEANAKAPNVLIAGDGRPLSPESMAAASDGLRWSGCNVVDLGAATAPQVAFAIDYLQADGGLLIGNPTGQPHTAGVRCWGPRARPLSAGGGLDQVRALTAASLDRPRRRWGRLQRCDVRAAYLATLAPYYHALRPLRLLLDTSSRPLIEALRELTGSVACEIVTPHDLPNPPVRDPKSHSLADQRTWLPDRLSMLANRVLAERVHFAIWIDGDGDACHLLDERGVRVAPTPLLCLLAEYFIGQGTTERTVVFEGVSPPDGDTPGGLRFERSDGRCEAMYSAMQQGSAVVGGGTCGRWWYRGPTPQSDALKTLTLLLCILSQSDRPLSEVAARLDGSLHRG